MRKMGKTGGRSTPSQDKASASNMADAPLTTEALVTELEKLRKTMTDELTTLLNTSLESIRSSVESIESTLVTQAGTIREMETSLTDHSDRITQIESEVCATIYTGFIDGGECCAPNKGGRFGVKIKASKPSRAGTTGRHRGR